MCKRGGNMKGARMQKCDNMKHANIHKCRAVQNAKRQKDKTTENIHTWCSLHVIPSPCNACMTGQAVNSCNCTIPCAIQQYTFWQLAHLCICTLMHQFVLSP